MSKYQIFEGVNRKSGSKVITVITHFAGKAVRGVAKCNPDKDEYDLPNGIALAQARCDAKFYEKRLKHAKSKREQARIALENAQRYLQKMNVYVSDASREFDDAMSHLKEIETEMNQE